MHIKAVLENIRNYVCAECGYATSMKSNLKQHIELFHEKIRILDLCVKRQQNFVPNRHKNSGNILETV